MLPIFREPAFKGGGGSPLAPSTASQDEMITPNFYSEDSQYPAGRKEKEEEVFAQRQTHGSPNLGVFIFPNLVSFQVSNSLK